jgi:hypothetical protein
MTIDMPSAPNFTDADFWLEANTQRFESPITKAVQRKKLGGGRWMATYTLPRMNRRQAAVWKAFFNTCEGSANAFVAFDPDCITPLGAGTGTPLVKGGSQTGSTLNIDGCTASVTNWLMAGDYFTVNGELKQLTQNAGTNGSGETTLSFKPALRSSPADNAPLTLVKASCTMVLIDDAQGQWRCDKNGIYDTKSFSAVEVF